MFDTKITNATWHPDTRVLLPQFLPGRPVAFDPAPGKHHPFAVAEDESGARAYFIRTWRQNANGQRWVRIDEKTYVEALQLLDSGEAGSTTLEGVHANRNGELLIELSVLDNGQFHAISRSRREASTWSGSHCTLEGAMMSKDGMRDVKVRISRQDEVRTRRATGPVSIIGFLVEGHESGSPYIGERVRARFGPDGDVSVTAF